MSAPLKKMTTTEKLSYVFEKKDDIKPVWNTLWKQWEVPDPKNAALMIPLYPASALKAAKVQVLEQLAAITQERDDAIAWNEQLQLDQDKLVAAQAREQVLREAIKATFPEGITNVTEPELWDALATQSDHAALDARLKEAYERAAKIVDGYVGCDSIAAAIRSLT
jgi:hypothetical protein